MDQATETVIIERLCDCVTERRGRLCKVRRRPDHPMARDSISEEGSRSRRGVLVFDCGYHVTSKEKCQSPIESGCCASAAGSRKAVWATQIVEGKVPGSILRKQVLRIGNAEIHLALVASGIQIDRLQVAEIQGVGVWSTWAIEGIIRRGTRRNTRRAAVEEENPVRPTINETAAVLLAVIRGGDVTVTVGEQHRHVAGQLIIRLGADSKYQ